MQRKTAIAIVGTGQEIEPAVSHAREVGLLAAQLGWAVITGGRNAGVMRAATDGAKQADESITIGILPGRDTQVADSVDVAIVTGTGEARNNIIVLSADVIIACGASDPGTASEIALALKNGKHVILLGVDDISREFFTGIGRDLVHLAESPAEAVGFASDIVSARSRASGHPK